MKYELRIGNNLTVLPTLPEKSVHCVITSPPYYGLRDYGTAQWEGGDPECDHVRFNRGENGNGGKSSTLTGARAGHKPPDYQDDLCNVLYTEVCGKCGARRIDEQIGLEKTPQEYICNLVRVFQEVWRVLRDDGTVWLNLGDSFAGSWGNYHPNSPPGKHGQRPKETARWNRPAYQSQEFRPPTANVPGLKPKDLMMIPARVALALQEDGWFLRQDIIWHKPNAMPESVEDRPANCHEHIFLLAKSERYFYDHLAVREPDSGLRAGNGFKRAARLTFQNDDGSLRGSDVPWRPGGGRNRRNVWTIRTATYKGAHFATFPKALVAPCILAGTSQAGCCPDCGTPYVRVISRSSAAPRDYAGKHSAGDEQASGRRMLANVRARRQAGGDHDNPFPEPVTIGWRPGCVCGLPGLRRDDMEVIETPTGERIAEDPSLFTGRAGMNRPRGEGEGSRPITRYEQRMYAAQLKASPHRAVMEAEAGPAFSHYVRTDRSGARPVPPDLLQSWLSREMLTEVVLPQPNAAPPVPCVVLDPFAGSGTAMQVANSLGRDAIGIELNAEYAPLIRERMAQGFLDLGTDEEEG